jgi:uncharacterized protein (DUF433 family)
VDGVLARKKALGFREEMIMNWRERIESDPKSMHGEPHVRGTDIAVSVVLNELVVYKDFHGVAACHPGLSEDDVGACVAWAAECSQSVVAADAPKSGADLKEYLLSMPDVGDDADFDAEEAEGQALPEGQTLMDVLLSMPNVGEDADFERPVSYGRPDVDLG